MRVPLLAMLLIGVLVAGCGSEADKAEDTASKAISGLGMGDEKQVCDQLTAAAQRQLLTVLADNPLGFPDIKASNCEQAITTLHSKLPPEIRASLEEGEVDEAKVDGEKAVVHVSGFGMDLELEKISDEWMITGGLFTRPGRGTVTAPQ
jgi:hypothetical protein